jgi:hypothetical protein
MRTSIVLASIVTAGVTASTLAALPSAAHAAELPQSINQPPTGPGTERVTRTGRPAGMHEGPEASAGVGSGFSDTYGLGLLGRLGYTFREGVYAGGQVQYFVGRSINDNQAHATFLGGEVGYKLFPTRQIEVRPYAFVGPAWITQVSSQKVAVTNNAAATAATGTVVDSQVNFAVQPGVLAEYHFGGVFVGGDAHYMVTPSPNNLAVMASAGFGF